MSTRPNAEIGTQIGSYRLEVVLGRGGMGVVYRAQDQRLGRKVALKLLSAELSHDERFRARFLRESRLAASIDHAGVIPIFEAGDADGQLYIAMRYVDGTDLAMLLRREGRLDLERALDLVGQLAGALDAAHDRGLIHRDVKPSNALVAREGAAEHVYLADFGLTKTAGPQTQTATDQLAGTALYMAPETIRGSDPDAAADRYALGCVLFECLTGDVPFGGSNEAAVIYGHLETPPPRASERSAGLPAALDAVLARALAKDPARRWPTCGEMLAAARAAFAAPRGAPTRRGPPSRRALTSGAAVVIVAAAAVVIATRSDGGAPLAAIRGDAVAVIDPGHRRLTAQVALDGSPSSIAAGGGAVWAADESRGTVARIDPATHTVRQTIAVGHGPSALGPARDGVWVANSQDGVVALITAASNAVADRIPVGGSPSDVCVAGGAVWVAGATNGTVMRLDPDTHARRAIRLDSSPSRLACGAGAVWALSEDAGVLTEIRPASGVAVRDIDVGAGAAGVAAAGDAVWVANPLSGTVSRVDARRGVVTATIPVGAADEPSEVAVGAGGVWVANRHAQTLARIDPVRAVLKKKLRLGNEPRALTVVHGALWVAVAAAGAGHRGGTLRLEIPQRLTRADLDTATAYTPYPGQILSITNDGLTAFRRTGGIAGGVLVPDLAQELPTPSDGGRTYVFRVRPGIRYSTGQPLRPSDIRRGIQRSLRASPPGASTLGAIAGMTPDDAHGTLQFRLKAPDPNFLYKLALPFAYAVPPGVGRAPAAKPIPATGPYRIANFRPRRSLRLERNPFYRTWSAAAKPDGYADAIDVTISSRSSQAVAAVRAERVDWIDSPLVQSSLAALRRRAPGQLHESVAPQTTWFWLNTRRPPFDDVDARRAINLAVDRRAAVTQAGGHRAARLTCQILPPDLPGFRPYCPYTAGAGAGRPWSGPDLAEARRLVASSGTRGAHIDVLSATPLFDDVTRLMIDTFKRLGYKPTLRTLPPVRYFPEALNPASDVDAGPLGWIADYPAAAGFLGEGFSCATANFSRFCDPQADRLMARASSIQAQEPRTADALWAQAERRVLDLAPVVPLFNPLNTDFVSRRVGNYRYNPQWGMLFDQAWVR